MYNEKAGSGTSAAAVRREIEAAGHRVVAELGASGDVRRALTEDVDVLAVAGGDGTVRSVAIQVSGCGVPIAVIPKGTANNFAASLEIEGDVGAIARSWDTARRVPIDLGVVRGPWGERRFLESAGAGLVAVGIELMDSEAPHPEEADRLEMLRKAVRRFGDVVATLSARRSRLSLDGEESEEDLLMVEALSTRSVGPRLCLAPAGRLEDGLFDVVTAGEAHRDELARYLRDREHGRRSEVRLPTRRAAHVELAGWESVHVDDRVLAGSAGAPLTMAVERAAIEVLTPETA